LESIREKFAKKDVVLLHGITSSGKTEIYFHLIKDAIENGKQVLYLLPEIAITSQMINRLKKVFGRDVGIYHSRFSDAERIAVYNRLSGDPEGEYKIILGVRSAVFLPFSRLGLIIVDEEHENSYKQFDPAPRYNARDSAIVLAKLHGAKVLLGTATPSVETYANCLGGKYEKVVLKERYRNIMLPEIIVSDVIAARKKKIMHSVFTPALIAAMESTFNKKKQVILFQNRRGFSSYVECQACGWIPKCKVCDVSLIYHKYNNSLVCHYCGYSRKLIEKCDKCGTTMISTKGFGTERIEDDIGLIFPGIRVARLDLDVAKSKNSYDKVLDAFGKGEIDILVGTQMISKGLDFENVALVGIIDADQMLNYPDFRAYERSYQLMSQVSGRAGRKDERGKVIIQTTDTSNPVIKYVRENDFESMFDEQISERQLFKYPPFVRMIKISIRNKNHDQLVRESRHISDKLRLAFGNRVYGPQSPLIGRISSYYLMEILLKIEKQSSFSKARGLLKNIIRECGGNERSAGTKIILDVDPL
jgi:primosomal protein N' (replication factor Y)